MFLLSFKGQHSHVPHPPRPRQPQYTLPSGVWHFSSCEHVSVHTDHSFVFSFLSNFHENYNGFVLTVKLLEEGWKLFYLPCVTPPPPPFDTVGIASFFWWWLLVKQQGWQERPTQTLVVASSRRVHGELDSSCLSLTLQSSHRAQLDTPGCEIQVD